MNDIKRGDVWFIEYEKTNGSEQSGYRPAIIVSNDIGNHYSPVVEVVWLTTADKKPLPTHICIRNSTALCEQITTIDKKRLTDFKFCCTDEEMMNVNRGLMISLGIVK